MDDMTGFYILFFGFIIILFIILYNVIYNFSQLSEEEREKQVNEFAGIMKFFKGLKESNPEEIKEAFNIKNIDTKQDELREISYEQRSKKEIEKHRAQKDTGFEKFKINKEDKKRREKYEFEEELKGSQFQEEVYEKREKEIIENKCKKLGVSKVTDLPLKEIANLQRELDDLKDKYFHARDKSDN